MILLYISSLSSLWRSIVEDHPLSPDTPTSPNLPPHHHPPMFRSPHFPTSFEFGIHDSSYILLFPTLCRSIVGDHPLSPDPPTSQNLPPHHHPPMIRSPHSPPSFEFRIHESSVYFISAYSLQVHRWRSSTITGSPNFPKSSTTHHPSMFRSPDSPISFEFGNHDSSGYFIIAHSLQVPCPSQTRSFSRSDIQRSSALVQFFSERYFPLSFGPSILRKIFLSKVFTRTTG